jgi:DoxX-like family
MIFTGLGKVLVLVPPEALAKYGLGEQVRLIGAGSLLTALLLLIPRTSSLGILLTSSFWGGAICIHMAHGEPYLFQAVLFVLLWIGAYLRNPATFSSFSDPPGMTREVAAKSEPAVP